MVIENIKPEPFQLDSEIAAFNHFTVEEWKQINVALHYWWVNSEAGRKISVKEIQPILMKLPLASWKG